MKKRVLSLILAAVMVCAVVPAAMAAEYTVTEVISCKYDEAEDFSEGLARVKLDGKVVFVDKTGKVVVSTDKYSSVAQFFCDGLALVIVDTGEKDAFGLSIYKRGYIDKTGKEVISCKYDGAWSFDKDLATVYVNTDEKDEYGASILKYGYIDTTGKEIVPCKYNNVVDFSEGLAAVKLDGKWGYIDTTGKEVIPCALEYDAVDCFFEGLAHVRQDGKNGFIDKTGKEVVPCKYDYVEWFSDGMAPVELDGKFGYVDATGKEVVPCKYNSMNHFSGGFAAVRIGGYDDGKVGLIDKTGKEVVPMGKYDEVLPIGQGIAQVMLNGKYGFIAITAINTASPTNDKLAVDGGAAAPTAYKISGSNYFKLRDVAALLNGSAKQFDVGYDSATKSVTITTGKGYAAQATDLQPAPSGQAEASTSNNAVYIDGVKAELTVYKINGNNYFKLRDLGQTLDFYVGWESGRGMFIETDKGYDPAS